VDGKNENGSDQSQYGSSNKRTNKGKTKQSTLIEAEKNVETETTTSGMYYWNEYFDIGQKQWICVDPLLGCVDKLEKIEFQINETMVYVITIDDEMGVRELSAKYLKEFVSSKFKRRQTSSEWMRKTFSLKILNSNETRSRIEDGHIYEHLKSLPMPTTISEFKRHPLYVLERDLLKFEAIYPPDTESLGKIGQRHLIYPRSAVHKLEGSLNWIKEARTIKQGEAPYKVVKARPKLNVPKEMRTPLTLDLFGYWQTEPYIPLEVVDGKIPKNEFGNIYMYKEGMLPKKCVHLRLPGIFQVARRMDLEAVPAVVGWEFAGCNNIPILDGCVVLQKDEELLRSAWQEMARNKAQKYAKKISDRIWQNWRKIIKGKILLEKIRNEFK